MRPLRLLCLLLLPLATTGCVVAADVRPAPVYGYGYGYYGRPYYGPPAPRAYDPPPRYYGYGYGRPRYYRY